MAFAMVSVSSRTLESSNRFDENEHDMAICGERRPSLSRHEPPAQSENSLSHDVTRHLEPSINSINTEASRSVHLMHRSIQLLPYQREQHAFQYPKAVVSARSSSHSALPSRTSSGSKAVPSQHALPSAALSRPLRIGTDCSGMDIPVMALRSLTVPFEHVFSCDNDPLARTTNVSARMIQRAEDSLSIMSFNIFATSHQAFSFLKMLRVFALSTMVDVYVS